jgi:hypothetical protein
MCVCILIETIYMTIYVYIYVLHVYVNIFTYHIGRYQYIHIGWNVPMI